LSIKIKGVNLSMFDVHKVNFDMLKIAGVVEIGRRKKNENTIDF